MNKITHLASMALGYALRRRALTYPPFMVSIEATNVCNFRCDFCPQSDPEHRERRERGILSVEHFSAFLSKVIESGMSNKNMSITLDGEPTLNKSLPEFIRIANQYGRFPRFSSNAFILDNALADRLVAAGAFLVSIDFSSEAAFFEKVRGTPESFEVVKRNILYLVELARKNPKVKLEIVDISAYAGAQAAGSLALMNSILAANGPLPANVKTWTRVFHNFCGHMEDRPEGNYVVCPYPWSQFVAAWNGDVVACCRDTSARTVLGNVFKSPVMEIWNGNPYRDFRAALAQGRSQDVAACSKCDMPYSKGSKRWNPLYLLSSLLRR